MQAAKVATLTLLNNTTGQIVTQRITQRQVDTYMYLQELSDFNGDTAPTHLKDSAEEYVNSLRWWDADCSFEDIDEDKYL